MRKGMAMATGRPEAPPAPLTPSHEPHFVLDTYRFGKA